MTLKTVARYCGKRCEIESRLLSNNKKSRRSIGLDDIERSVLQQKLYEL